MSSNFLKIKRAKNLIQMKLVRLALLASTIITIALIVSCDKKTNNKGQVITQSKEGYAGSESCKECHARFYELWEPSHHGKAMQPINKKFISENSYPASEKIKVGDKWYKVLDDQDKMQVAEYATKDGTELKRYEAVWTLGGRNISYFLTPMEGGRLQTLPLAYDENRKEWYSTPASAMRHFPNNTGDGTDQELPWTHSLYTFNTTCHSCHVSQLNNNFDLKTNKYHTTWKESGINCETCHGPSQEHVRVCKEAGEGNVPDDLKIIITSTFTPDQHDWSCSSCHAKMNPLTASYPPGEDFWQHFNLMTLENPDYYVDGRDLGENYTYTTWLQSKCADESDLHCVSCHTSSGRYRFKGEKHMVACAKCHQEQANNFEKHSHHPAGKDITCVSCHMPTTEFARMTRSDHSMRPPMPAATIEFGSPNACNSCHDDKTPQWANKHVTKWKGNKYQQKTLQLGRLVLQARKGEWKNLNAMVEVVKDTTENIVFRNSLIRLMYSCNDSKLLPVYLELMKADHPMLRGSATEGLRSFLNQPEAKTALLEAAKDKYRLVRMAAATVLSAYPAQSFSPMEKAVVDKVFAEYQEFLVIRPDSWGSHYNQGNFHHQQGNYHAAIDAFKQSAKLEGEVVEPLVNASMSYSMLGDFAQAEEKLLEALKRQPNNAAANFNYGLLMGQMKRMDEAKAALEKALQYDKNMAPAAYNLAVMYAQTDLNLALNYSKKAWELAADNVRYGYTYAFYLQQNNQIDAAIKTLKKVLATEPNYGDAYQMIASLYQRKKDTAGMKQFFRKCLKRNNIDPQLRNALQQMVR
ncbi:hypothetical protein EMN47_04865 [Prolixibacteraceae bacterium JC049]|nr:hypothetical protein [Prolixibacteraceae bacterium JC049]